MVEKSEAASGLLATLFLSFRNSYGAAVTEIFPRLDLPLWKIFIFRETNQISCLINPHGLEKKLEVQGRDRDNRFPSVVLKADGTFCCFFFLPLNLRSWKS